MGVNVSTGDWPVVVIGAGPVGLAAAARLHERRLPFVVLEAGDAAGAAVAEWGHVRLFSPWRWTVDAASRVLLEAAGWSEPDPDVLPTGGELVEEYLRTLAAVPQLAPHVRYGARVVAVARRDMDVVRTAGRQDSPFVVRLASGEEITGRAVIDASGTWRTPNPLGGNGLPALGENRLDVEPAMPDVLGVDRARFVGVHTLVVGSGHSAAGTIAALVELAGSAPGTRVSWAVRRGGAEHAYGGGDADALAARGALGSRLRMLVEAGQVELVTGFAVHDLARTTDGRVAVTSTASATVVVDRVVAATGFRPDHSIATELRLDLDPTLGCTRALAPLIDPNEHSCGTVRPHGVDELTQPEPGYFAVGMKSYGRAPTFLMATGYEQVRSIVAALAGDWAAARQVHLDLPQTGVCSVSLNETAELDAAIARFGLAPEVPAAVVSAALRHLPGAGSTSHAVALAAADLGLDPAVAVQLAALAGDRFPTGPGDLPSPSVGGGCCGPASADSAEPAPSSPEVTKPGAPDGASPLTLTPVGGGAAACCG